MSKIAEHQAEMLTSELGIDIARPVFIYRFQSRTNIVVAIKNIGSEVVNIINPFILYDVVTLQKFCMEHNMLIQASKDGNSVAVNNQIRPIIAQYIIGALKVIGLEFMYHQGKYYFYNGEYYKFITLIEIEQDVITPIVNKIKMPAGQLITLKKYTEEFIARVKSMTIENPKDTTIVNFQNGLLLIKEGELKLIDHSPDYFVTYRLNYKYDEKATCFKFLSYLQDVLPDVDSRAVLQEFLGYCLTKGKTLSKMLIIHGSGSNGKSVLCDIVTALFGRENLSSFSLGELSHKDTVRFEAMDKMLNFCPDIESKAKLQTDTVKLMCSNEYVGVRELYGRPLTVKWEPKLIFNVNILPKVEQSEGFLRRFLIITFNQKIPYDKIDINLSSKIIAEELPGIMNWVIDGMKRLISNNFILTRSKKIENALKVYSNDSDTFMLFLSDMGYSSSYTARDSVPIAQLQKTYKSYCNEMGIQNIRSRTSILQTLQNEGYQIVEDKEGRKCVFYRKDFK